MAASWFCPKLNIRKSRKEILSGEGWRWKFSFLAPSSFFFSASRTQLPSKAIPHLNGGSFLIVSFFTFRISLMPPVSMINGYYLFIWSHAPKFLWNTKVSVWKPSILNQCRSVRNRIFIKLGKEACDFLIVLSLCLLFRTLPVHLYRRQCYFRSVEISRQKKLRWTTQKNTRL